MSEEEVELYCKKQRRGKWRRRRGAPIAPGSVSLNTDLAPENDIYDASGQLQPERLIGKLLKVRCSVYATLDAERCLLDSLSCYVCVLAATFLTRADYDCTDMVGW